MQHWTPPSPCPCRSGCTHGRRASASRSRGTENDFEPGENCCSVESVLTYQQMTVFKNIYPRTNCRLRDMIQQYKEVWYPLALRPLRPASKGQTMTIFVSIFLKSTSTYATSRWSVPGISLFKGHSLTPKISLKGVKMRHKDGFAHGRTWRNQGVWRLAAALPERSFRAGGPTPRPRGCDCGRHRIAHLLKT